MHGRQAVESGAWADVDGDWHHLFGGFAPGGASIEWHEFTVAKPLDWAKSFHPYSLEICLNFGGDGILRCKRGEFSVRPGEAVVYVVGQKGIVAHRLPGGIHRFATFEMGPTFLKNLLKTSLHASLPGVREFCDSCMDGSAVLWQGPIPHQHLGLRRQLLKPPVNPEAAGIWFQAKTLELCASLLIAHSWEGELFCERQKRITRERCEMAYHLLERDLENPPSLEMLATEVGWSPSHLSRSFTEHYGMGISAALRKIRIEKAAALLREGCTVTDAAFAVGYSSLGSFYKAFSAQTGQSPGSLGKSSPTSSSSDLDSYPFDDWGIRREKPGA